MNKTTLLTVGIIVAVAMLSTGLAIVPIIIQQASANLMDGEDGDDIEFSFEQDQSNRCNGLMEYVNEGIIAFGVE